MFQGNKNIFYVNYWVIIAAFFALLCTKHNQVFEQRQVGRTESFHWGAGYNWWGSLWQRRELMIQNHKSSC